MLPNLVLTSMFTVVRTLVLVRHLAPADLHRHRHPSRNRQNRNRQNLLSAQAIPIAHTYTSHIEGCYCFNVIHTRDSKVIHRGGSLHDVHDPVHIVRIVQSRSSESCRRAFYNAGAAKHTLPADAGHRRSASLLYDKIVARGTTSKSDDEMIYVSHETYHNIILPLYKDRARDVVCLSDDPEANTEPFQAGQVKDTIEASTELTCEFQKALQETGYGQSLPHFTSELDALYTRIGESVPSRWCMHARSACGGQVSALRAFRTKACFIQVPPCATPPKATQGPARQGDCITDAPAERVA